MSEPVDSEPLGRKALGVSPAGASARGIGFFLLAMLGFVLMDTAAKYLTAEHSVAQIAWARYVFHFAVAVLLLSRARLTRIFQTKALPLQLLRSFILFAATCSFYVAIAYLPLAEAISISYVAPIILTGLSALLLRERVGPRRWAAVFVGFAGVLIIIRPGTDVFQWEGLFLVGTATCYALYQITTRMLSGRDSSFTTVFYTGIVGAIVTSIAAPFFWTSPSWLGWGLFVGLGVMGLGAHYCIIKALEYLPASYLAPYEYFALIWAVIMGYVVFGDFPDGIAIAGAAVIAGSGLYIFYRDRREETARARFFMARK
jgi:drug/metabolite transporter (DMT)-like permease